VTEQMRVGGGAAAYRLALGPHSTETPPVHSELGASICDRWWNCPGSVALSRGIPRRSSKYAEEGTAAHELAADCLRYRQDAAEWLGRRVGRSESCPEGFTVSEEMAEAVQVYLDACRVLFTPAAGHAVEARFDLGALDPPAPMYGTADFIAYDRATRTVYVADFKYGRGVRVKALGNPQLKYYALGAVIAVHPLPVSRVVAHVVQPRGFDGVACVPAIYDAHELAEWSVELMDRARAALDPAAPLVAGAWCKFCPAGGSCPAQAAAALAVAQVEFGSDADPVPAIRLNNEQRAWALDRAEILEGWLRALRAGAEADIVAGQVIPGWQVVETQGRDRWRDPAEAAVEILARYGVDVTESVTISPAVARGRLTAAGQSAARLSWESAGMPKGRKPTKSASEDAARSILKLFTMKPPAGSALVPSHDKRPAIAGGGSEFATLPAQPAEPEIT
jgi:hypothetical protein